MIFDLALVGLGCGLTGFVAGIVAYRVALPWVIARAPSPLRILLPLVEEAGWWAARPRRPWIGAQRGRHLARPGNRPFPGAEGLSERGSSPGSRAPDLAALQPAAARHARKLTT